MATEHALHQADHHRANMRRLGTSQNQEIQQVAQAVLDTMAWLDSNFTDLQGLLDSVSQLESNLAAAHEKIRALEARPVGLG